MSNIDVERDVLRALRHADASALARALMQPEAIVYTEFYKPLHRAASEGFAAGCAALVGAGCAIDVIDDAHGVPLDDAVAHPDTVAWFIANGALVDGHETCASTPLMSAARGGHLESTRLLLDAGAELEREASIAGNAFDLAYAWNHTGKDRDGRGGQHDEVIELLRSRGGYHAYVGKHDWRALPASTWLERLEKDVGPLNARVTRVNDGGRELLLVRSHPRTWADSPNVFITSGLAHGQELGIILPSKWPLNRDALQQFRFSWPLELLVALGSRLTEGAKLRAGEVLEPGDSRLTQLDLPRYAWHCWEALPSDASRGTPSLVLLVPEVLPAPGKRRYPPRLPDSLVKPKWDRLMVQLGDRTPRRLLPESPKPASRQLYPNTPPVPTTVEYVTRPVQEIPKDGGGRAKAATKRPTVKAKKARRPEKKKIGATRKAAPTKPVARSTAAKKTRRPIQERKAASGKPAPKKTVATSRAAKKTPRTK